MNYTIPRPRSLLLYIYCGYSLWWDFVLVDVSWWWLVIELWCEDLIEIIRFFIDTILQVHNIVLVIKSLFFPYGPHFWLWNYHNLIEIKQLGKYLEFIWERFRNFIEEIKIKIYQLFKWIKFNYEKTSMIGGFRTMGSNLLNRLTNCLICSI